MSRVVRLVGRGATVLLLAGVLAVSFYVVAVPFARFVFASFGAFGRLLGWTAGAVAAAVLDDPLRSAGFLVGGLVVCFAAGWLIEFSERRLGGPR